MMIFICIVLIGVGYIVDWYVEGLKMISGVELMVVCDLLKGVVEVFVGVYGV